MAERVHLLAGYRPAPIAEVPDDRKIAEFPSGENGWRQYLRTEDRDETSGLRVSVSIGTRTGPEAACTTCMDEYTFRLYQDRVAVELAIGAVRHSVLLRCIDCGRLYEEVPEDRRPLVELDHARARQLYPGAL